MHRSNKTNLTNVSSRHPDYMQIINESIDRLLSILQRKLAAMSATIFKFLIIISCLKTICHVCEEQNDIRSRKSWFNWHILREQRDEQLLVHWDCSVTQVLNSVAETVGCKQLVLCVLILEMISCEMIYDDSSEFFLELVWTLQLNSSLVQVQKTDRMKRKCSHVTESLR